MKLKKKQIKKELRKTINLVSKLNKKKIVENQDSLVNLYNDVNDIKNIIKDILTNKTYNIQEEKGEKDLETK
jgi:hypothetical protein